MQLKHVEAGEVGAAVGDAAHAVQAAARSAAGAAQRVAESIVDGDAVAQGEPRASVGVQERGADGDAVAAQTVCVKPLPMSLSDWFDSWHFETFSYYLCCRGAWCSGCCRGWPASARRSRRR